VTLVDSEAAPEAKTDSPAGAASATAASDGGMAAAISIRGVSKSFARRQADGDRALDDVDLEVEPGEFLVLLGPSGCGKTTLLRSIAGLERPDTGSISIDGTTFFDGERKLNVDAGRRPVTMIFQSYALWPHMTAARNVAFPLRCTGVPHSQIGPRVQEMLDKVGIGHLGHRYPGEMSGGQQQRLALARALASDQRVVLFDEPLSNVDAQVREKLRIELIKMQRTIGFTAIYVTHDQSEAMGLADRIAVMANGRVAQLDTPRTLYRHPATIDVARFLGQSNELPFAVESFDSSTSIVSGTGSFGLVRATWEGDAPPAPGEELVAFGRPGDFALDAATASGAGNQWEGTIEAMRFFGTHVEYVVRVGENRLRCWVSGDRRSELSEESELHVSVAPENLRAVRET
jgi:iron(III) transport system ATP-binding protein